MNKSLSLDQYFAAGAYKNETLQRMIVPYSFLFTKVHPSWFEAQLSPLSSDEIPIYCSILPSSYQEYFTWPDTKPHIQEEWKEMILQHLWEKTFPSQYLLHPEFFQDSPAFFLFDFKELELYDFLLYLGLFDLGSIYHKIVDGRLLRKIVQLLTPLEKRFLETIANLPVQCSLKLELHDFLHTKNDVRNVFITRGVFRILFLLQREEESFLFYLIHKLPKKDNIFLNKTVPFEEKHRPILEKQMDMVKEVLCAYSH